MKVKVKANKRCLVCKKPISEGQDVLIQKNGIVIHVDNCLQEMKDVVRGDVQSLR